MVESIENLSMRCRRIELYEGKLMKWGCYGSAARAIHVWNYCMKSYEIIVIRRHDETLKLSAV